jgi:hypothetical protein
MLFANLAYQFLDIQFPAFPGIQFIKTDPNVGAQARSIYPFKRCTVH